MLLGIEHEFFKGLSIELHSVGPEILTENLKRLLHDGGQQRHAGRERPVVLNVLESYRLRFAQGAVEAAKRSRGTLADIVSNHLTMHDGMYSRSPVIINLGGLEILEQPPHQWRALLIARRNLVNQGCIH
jgi:hypothetical protein